jgi:hypothetical protein
MSGGTDHQVLVRTHFQQLRADRSPNGSDNAFGCTCLCVFAKSGDEVSWADTFNGSAITEGSSGKACIYHHQSVAYVPKRRQVVRSADGVHTGDRDLSSVVVVASTDFADHGGRFDLAVLLRRLVEQFIGMGDNEGMERIRPGELSNHLTEDDRFARRRRFDQQLVPARVLLVGGDHTSDAGLLIRSQDDGRARWCGQGRAGCDVYGMDLLPKKTLHLPKMAMTSGVETMPLCGKAAPLLRKPRS